MLRVFCLVFGYVFGLFQTGYLYGRMNHIDIRNYGSGNSGTTNALRVLGKKAGVPGLRQDHHVGPIPVHGEADQVLGVGEVVLHVPQARVHLNTGDLHRHYPW